MRNLICNRSIVSAGFPIPLSLLTVHINTLTQGPEKKSQKIKKEHKKNNVAKKHTQQNDTVKGSNLHAIGFPSQALL
jgi:hypothetical protein